MWIIVPGIGRQVVARAHLSELLHAEDPEYNYFTPPTKEIRQIS